MLDSLSFLPVSARAQGDTLAGGLPTVAREGRSSCTPLWQTRAAEPRSCVEISRDSAWCNMCLVVLVALQAVMQVEGADTKAEREGRPAEPRTTVARGSLDFGTRGSPPAVLSSC